MLHSCHTTLLAFDAAPNLVWMQPHACGVDVAGEAKFLSSTWTKTASNLHGSVSKGRMWALWKSRSRQEWWVCWIGHKGGNAGTLVPVVQESFSILNLICWNGLFLTSSVEKAMTTKWRHKNQLALLPEFVSKHVWRSLNLDDEKKRQISGMHANHRKVPTTWAVHVKRKI